MKRIIFAAVLLQAGGAFASNADIVETVHLKITGGPKAGQYDTSGTRGGCSAGLTGPASFGNQLSNPKETDPEKFNSLQLIVPVAKASTDQFFLSVGFGPLLHRSVEYKVDTQKGSKQTTGSGEVTIEDHGTTAKITFAAKTADGVHLDGSIDCKTVTRAQ